MDDHSLFRPMSLCCGIDWHHRWAKRLGNLKIVSGIIILGLCTCALIPSSACTDVVNSQSIVPPRWSV